MLIGFRSTHVQPGFPHHLPRQQGFGHARMRRAIFVVYDNAFDNEAAVLSPCREFIELLLISFQREIPSIATRVQILREKCETVAHV